MFRKFWQAIFGNFKLKLLALVISLAIWFYATSQLTEEAELRVPLTIEAPPGYKVLKQSSPEVRVGIAGPQSLAARLSSEAKEGYLEMSRALTDEELAQERITLQVNPAWLDISESELVQLRVAYLEPKEVIAYVSALTERTLPVRAQLTIEAREGFEIVGTAVVPSRVRVRGPQRVLEKLEHIRTESVAAWDVHSDSSWDNVALLAEETVELESGHEATVPLQLSSKSVRVQVTVRAQEGEQSFGDVPVYLLMLPTFPYEVELPSEQKHVSVVVKGLPPNLERLKPGSFRAYVDLTDMPNEEIPVGSSHMYVENIMLHLPEDIPVGSVRLEPSKVEIRLKNPGKQAE